MATRNIIAQKQDAGLRKKTREVTSFNQRLFTLLDDMAETMRSVDGVGLAAPQVGVLRRVAVVDVGDGLIELINPILLEASEEEQDGVEGCLSVPDIHENVTRKSQITIRYQDENFVEQTKTFEGMPARVIQHEYDHLLGKTFIEHLTSLKKTLLKRKLNDISTGKTTPFYKTKPTK